MTKTIRKFQSIFLFSIPFFLLAIIIFFSQSQLYFDTASTISSYLILDLLLTVPLIYFLVIRKTKIPNTTVVPMIFLGLILGYYILPVDQHYYLDVFKNYIAPIIELSVVAFVIWKVRSAIKAFKEKKQPGVDFYTVLQNTCRELVPGKISSFLVSEISVIYYGFVNWKQPTLSENDFTYHKKSGSPSLFGALIFIVLVETISVHIILLQWSHLAAIILSILSIYTGIQLLGFGRSLSQRPITIEEDTLVLRYGILNESNIKIADIESIELSRKTLQYDDEVRKFSLLGDLESHNVVIRCNRSQTMQGIYGITKSYTTLALHVDDKEGFKEMLEERMQLLNS